jgi:hypothetical protein
MTEYFLKINNDGSLNRGYLSVWENGKETILISDIKEATKKGWRSSKVIIEHLDIISQESEVDLIITEDCAMKIIDKYGNITTKTYTPEYYVPFSAAHAIANFCTKNGTDPYDRG